MFYFVTLLVVVTILLRVVVLKLKPQMESKLCSNKFLTCHNPSQVLI